MQNYNNSHTKEIFSKARQDNTKSIVRTTSTKVSAALLPMIIILINKTRYYVGKNNISKC